MNDYENWFLMEAKKEAMCLIKDGWVLDDFVLFVKDLKEDIEAKVVNDDSSIHLVTDTLSLTLSNNKEIKIMYQFSIEDRFLSEELKSIGKNTMCSTKVRSFESPFPIVFRSCYSEDEPMFTIRVELDEIDITKDFLWISDSKGDYDNLMKDLLAHDGECIHFRYGEHNLHLLDLINIWCNYIMEE